MAQVIVKHTTTANLPPGALDPGELSAELNNPTRLWVGTPTGNKKLIEVGAGGLQFVDVTGDTMTGPLVLFGDPVAPLGAATKQYVDALIAALNTAIAGKVAKGGDTMTGPLLLPAANPTAGLHAAHKKYVDAAAAAVTPPPVFAAGTQTLFYMAAPPVGWTVVTAHNDKTLRVVSGNGGVAGGSYAFSTVMAQTVVGNFTETVSTMPSHTHATWQAAWGATYPGANVGTGQGSGGYVDGSYVGSNAAHPHGLYMSVQYIDLILASKN
jgi:hypothetical protein